MITTFYPPYSFGGDGLFVQALSRALARDGHTVDVIHSIDSYSALTSATPLPSASEPEGVAVHGIRNHLPILEPLAVQQTGRPIFNSREILRILNSKPFDVIHFHNVSLIGGPGVLSYGSALKLYTLHEYWLLCPMHVLFRNNRELCTEKHCISCTLRHGRLPQLWRYSGLLEKQVREVGCFIAPTDFTRRLHLDSGLPMQIRVLGNFHQPLPDELPAVVRERPYFLYAGRLERLKGIHELIEDFATYRGADLVVAGDGTIASKVRAMANGLDHIHFLGQIGRRELTSLMAGAVALIVPSLVYEVFPLVMLESFAQGTPVVARNIGSLREVVRTSGGGILYQDRDSLHSALSRLQAEPDLRDELGKMGFEAWRQNWTLERHLAQYLDLVEEMSARRELLATP